MKSIGNTDKLRRLEIAIDFLLAVPACVVVFFLLLGQYGSLPGSFEDRVLTLTPWAAWYAAIVLWPLFVLSVAFHLTLHRTWPSRTFVVGLALMFGNFLLTAQHESVRIPLHATFILLLVGTVSSYFLMVPFMLRMTALIDPTFPSKWNEAISTMAPFSTFGRISRGQLMYGAVIFSIAVVLVQIMGADMDAGLVCNGQLAFPSFWPILAAVAAAFGILTSERRWVRVLILLMYWLMLGISIFVLEMTTILEALVCALVLFIGVWLTQREYGLRKSSL